MSAPEAADGRAPGRPRSEEADRAIVEATLRLLREVGYERMSLESVARAAGVGKATIYRRHRDKPDLAAAAVETVGGDVLAPVDTGDTRSDLLEMVRRFVAVMAAVGMPMVEALMAERVRHPELMERFRARVVLPRRALLRSLLERGITRGEVRADVDPELAVDALIGPLFSRHLALGEVPGDWPERIVDSVWRGLASR